MKLKALMLAGIFFFLPIFATGTPGVLAAEAGQVSALVSGNSQFAFEMYKQISLSDGEKNIFFSPLSISTALGMTYAGARGETEKQMAATMHFTLPQRELHEAFSEVSRQMKASGKGYQLNIANALWGQKGSVFSDDFLAVAKRYYEGGFNGVNFVADTEGSRQAINSWVEEKTAGKIRDLLHNGDINSLTRLVLTNAIYFKGDWAAKFDKAQTRLGLFYTGPDQTVEVPMMHQAGSFGYVATERMEAVELPYAGGALSMVVLLPRKGSSASDVELTPAEMDHLLAGLSEQKVEVLLPKFKFEARYGLSAILCQMGMKDAFSATAADFSGITGRPGLYISDVIHQAVIEVNEEGSEAAAATAVIMAIKSSLGSPIPVFAADRPFVFLIRHKPTGSILFMGRVANPTLQ
ncbi:MAG: serpin family protein [Negativicutes bacterium]|nr:serpin family protein [Negativicutes bacterium]